MVNKVLRLTLFILFVGIGFYVITGFSSLMMADDYCYFSLLKNYTFFTALSQTYISATVIAGNRFSATFFSMLASLFGTNIIKVGPLISISTFMLALIFMVTKKMELFQVKRNHTLIIVISLTFLGILFYITPSRFQNIYWYSGVIAYTTPLIFYSLLIGLYYSFVKHENKPKFFIPILFVLSMITTGFSETSAIAFLVHFSLIMVLFIFTKKIKAQEPENYIPLIGLIVGVILLIVSPSAISRNSGNENLNGFGFIELIKLLTTSFTFGFDFIIDMIKSFSLPIIVLLVGMISLGGLIEFPYRHDSLRSLIIFQIYTFLSTFIIISASMSPQIFAFGAYPNERSQIIPLYFLLLGVSIIGISLGIIIINKLKINRKSLVFLLLVISIYLLRAGFTEYSHVDDLSKRSKVWKERNSYIVSQVEKGMVDITIPGIDSIETIMDFNPMCLRDYYQINNIEIIN